MRNMYAKHQADWKLKERTTHGFDEEHAKIACVFLLYFFKIVVIVECTNSGSVSINADAEMTTKKLIVLRS